VGEKKVSVADLLRGGGLVFAFAWLREDGGRMTHLQQKMKKGKRRKKSPEVDFAVDDVRVYFDYSVEMIDLRWFRLGGVAWS
jgi:hypothetical protein